MAFKYRYQTTDGPVRSLPLTTGAATIDVVAAAGTFTRAAGSFLSDGFGYGMSITTSGFANPGNNGTFVIATVTETVITVTDNTGMVNESGVGGEYVGSTIPELPPTPGSVLAAIPTGTTPDFIAKQFQGLKLCFLTDNTSGTVTFNVWARDMVEFGDANNRNPDPPADLTKVLWVKIAKAVTIEHLEEYKLTTVNKRAIYVQVTALGGGAATADLFVSPYESAQPYTSI